MPQPLDDHDLKITPGDNLAVRAAKISLATGRQLGKPDDPQMLRIIQQHAPRRRGQPAPPAGTSPQPVSTRNDADTARTTRSIAASVARETGLPIDRADHFVNTVLTAVGEHLRQGRPVDFPAFGTLHHQPWSTSVAGPSAHPSAPTAQE